MRFPLSEQFFGVIFDELKQGHDYWFPGGRSVKVVYDPPIKKFYIQAICHPDNIEIADMSGYDNLITPEEDFTDKQGFIDAVSDINTEIDLEERIRKGTA